MHVHAAPPASGHSLLRVIALLVIALLICLATVTSAHAKDAIVGGTGSSNDPYILMLNRPEAADGVHSPNSSRCWGKRGTTYQETSAFVWHPVHDSVVTCDGVYGVTNVQIHAFDEFTNALGARVGFTSCYAAGTYAPCSLYKIENDQWYGIGAAFTQKLHADLGLDAGVYRIGSYYYTFVWGPPTFMCNYPETLSVRDIGCDLYGLQVAAGESYTYFG